MLQNELENVLMERFLSKFSLSGEDERAVLEGAVLKSFKKDETIYTKDGCQGYAILACGRMRGFVSTSNFKEITVFSLRQGDSCMLCAFCSFGALQVEINLQIEEDTQMILIPKKLFKRLRENYPQVANHALELIAGRFSAAINVMEQALFMPLAQRIINFLEQNGACRGLKITHEQIANHLGSAREAVSRVLKEMQKQGRIEQKRGVVTLK